MISRYKIDGVSKVPFGKMINGLVRSWNQRATGTVGYEVDHARDPAMEAFYQKDGVSASTSYAIPKTFG